LAPSPGREQPGATSASTAMTARHRIARTGRRCRGSLMPSPSPVHRPSRSASAA
jgi:hypothetical protein